MTPWQIYASGHTLGPLSFKGLVPFVFPESFPEGPAGRRCAFADAAGISILQFDSM